MGGVFFETITILGWVFRWGKTLGFSIVVSHPSREAKARWMGHPGFRGDSPSW
jgi:hypothetical protein